jgi:trehalose 6-phosphate phosphatase
MRSIFSTDARDLLDDLATRRALLAFDFDGTLAPIVADHQQARVRPRTRALLRVLSLLYPCAVVSGRARADVNARLGGIPLLAVVGNHGAEPGMGPVNRTRRETIVAWKRALQAELSLLPGVEIEDKQLSLAVHYRQVPARWPTRQLVMRAAAALEGARISPGHAVVNVAPSDAPQKGAAVAELLRRAGSRPVLYVGDDRTDEDAFRAPMLTAGVRVGRTGRSAASWYVPDQAGMDEFLSLLLAARTRLDGLGDRWEGLTRAVLG